jgi:surface-anchored protein
LGHSHANWGFTTEGVYAVEMQISGDVMEYKEGVSTGPTTVYSDVETFTFLVGSSTVPEPGAIAMLSSAAVGLALSFWNRRRNTAMRV